MGEPQTVRVYTDYKSPYAFLAKDLIYELENEFDVRLEWLPYTLDIPSYLGSARLDELCRPSAHSTRPFRHARREPRRQPTRGSQRVLLGTDQAEHPIEHRQGLSAQ